MKKYLIFVLAGFAFSCSEVSKKVEVKDISPEISFKEVPSVLSIIPQGTIATLPNGKQIIYSDVITYYQNVVAKYQASTIRTPELQAMMGDMNRSISAFSIVMKQKNTPQQDGWSTQEESVYYNMHINTWNLIDRIDAKLTSGGT